MDLKEYRQKRDLKKTPEPPPSSGQNNKGKYLVFVVHKHAARRLHYDLRLEMDGVLKSFAIPKGPSLDPSVKRLAVHVEDHPFDYKDFEGVIPKGNYGAGNVIIWDKGFYGSSFSNDKKKGEEFLREGLQKGDLKFVLAGSKLKGEFALVKTRWDEKSWLLLKHKDKYTSSGDVLLQDRSVVTGKTVEELSSEPAAFKSLTSEEKKLVANEPLVSPGADAPTIPMPHKIIPMLAETAKKPFDHPEWLFEVKWDGYRAIAELDKTDVLLYSRNRTSFMKKFSPIVLALQNLGIQAVLDGEIVIVDNKGIPDFQKLQDYPKSNGGHLLYYVFDILYHNGKNMTQLPLVERKEILKSVILQNDCVKYSEHIWNTGESFFAAAKQKGLEGIVAKHSLSRYKPGTRSDNWLKIKNRNSQDCIIAGFTAPRGARKYFGSLVLGAYDADQFIYIGHSGGGLGTENLKSMFEKLQPLVRKSCPFKTVPPHDAPITWVKPVLVCEVNFIGWTKDAILRQPEFVRLRDDKTALETVIPHRYKGDIV